MTIAPISNALSASDEKNCAAMMVKKAGLMRDAAATAAMLDAT
jgi:hypothetical protein